MARTETTVMDETSAHEIIWLRTLEDKVHAAADRIRALREENAALRAQVEDLEERLTATPTGAAEAWAEERDEIRGRVERLVEHLEELGEI
jgi:predicted nuclease with TOPRIM domain